MNIDLDFVDVAAVLNIETLRTVLRDLSALGKKWWIACEPKYTAENGYIMVGFGDPGCKDRLNRTLYRFPVLNANPPLRG